MDTVQNSIHALIIDLNKKLCNEVGSSIVGFEFISIDEKDGKNLNRWKFACNQDCLERYSNSAKQFTGESSGKVVRTLVNKDYKTKPYFYGSLSVSQKLKITNIQKFIPDDPDPIPKRKLPNAKSNRSRPKITDSHVEDEIKFWHNALKDNFNNLASAFLWVPQPHIHIDKHEEKIFNSIFLVLSNEIDELKIYPYVKKLRDFIFQHILFIYMEWKRDISISNRDNENFKPDAIGHYPKIKIEPLYDFVLNNNDRRSQLLNNYSDIQKLIISGWNKKEFFDTIKEHIKDKPFNQNLAKVKAYNAGFIDSIIGRFILLCLYLFDACSETDFQKLFLKNNSTTFGSKSALTSQLNRRFFIVGFTSIVFSESSNARIDNVQTIWKSLSSHERTLLREVYQEISVRSKFKNRLSEIFRST
jgi:hypothetical protein